MKILKKSAAVFAAAAMAMGALSVVSHAEDMYKVHVDAPDASVGETVDVKVVIDAGSTGVGGISFMLSYDTAELELVSAKPGEELNGWITGDVDEDGNNSLNLDTPGKIGFAYVTMGKGFSDKSVDLILASFRVLKPNAALTLTNVDVTADDMDGTGLTGGSEGAVVKCSHKNTQTQTNPATCKDDGKEETVCKDCGTLIKTETLPATGEHNWEEEVTKPASCTEKGSKTLTCKVCGETKTEEIPALGHDWDEGNVTVQPTCTEKGVKTLSCARCGATDTEEIPALGHDWGEWTVIKEATESEEGEESRRCKVCDETETREIEKLPPVVTTTTYEANFHVPEATTAATAATSAAESQVTATDPAAEAQATTPVPVTEAKPAETTAAPETQATEAVSAPAETSTAPVSSDSATTSPTASSSGGAGNTGGGSDKGDNTNESTGVALAVIPAIAAAAGILIFKKRK